ncbi:hypothetical protein V8G54_030344 [Vigna mungo]|uniref:Uncharacterized protein n=1 Tax=Vigna mungo TaxID=3915 RepID=A0AAQ3RK05_VIGMU
MVSDCTTIDAIKVFLSEAVLGAETVLLQVSFLLLKEPFSSSDPQRRFPYKIWQLILHDPLILHPWYVKREHLIDVTEVFRVVNAEKKFRIVKLALYLTVLIVTIFRLTLIAVYYLGIEDDDDLGHLW